MYRVEIPDAVLKQMNQLPKTFISHVKRDLYALAQNPRPHGVVKIQGYSNRYRIRVGNYRIIYRIEDDVLLVTVIKVAHRREVYR